MLKQICEILDGLENKEDSEPSESIENKERCDVTRNDEASLAEIGPDLEPILVFHFDRSFVLWHNYREDV